MGGEVWPLLINQNETVDGDRDFGYYTEKKSKFYGFVYRITKKTDVMAHVKGLKLQYPRANHFTYGWILGNSKLMRGSTDDREPQGVAGEVILNQLENWGLQKYLC